MVHRLVDSPDDIRTLHLFGPFQLRESGARAGRIPGGHAKLLLQRLAAKAPDPVDPHALEAMLWPADPPPTAARTLASLISRLRSALGTGAIVGSPTGGYALAIGDDLTTDLARVEALAQEAQTRIRDSPALAISATQAGLDSIGRGPLLGGEQIDADWFDELERRVEALRRRLQRVLWECEAQLGQWDQVIDRATAVLTLDSHDEEATRALMTAYWHMGDRGSALNAHEVLRVHLRAQLDAEPSGETDALFHQIATTVPGTPPFDGPRHAVSVGGSFVGRQDQIGKLLDLWAAVGRGEPQSALITGHPGSGRTRLAAEFAELTRRAGAQVQVCGCYEAQHSAFLEPILQVLGRAVLSKPSAEITTLAGRWLDTLAYLIPEVAMVCDVGAESRASPDLEHRRAMQMIVHVISQLARDRPLLLVFDDLQHAGASTIEALQWIVRELPSVPVMVVATAPEHGDRTLNALREDSAVVALGALSRSEVDAIAVDRGHETDAGFIWDLSQGHVLFVVEIIASLDRGVGPGDIPGSLSNLVLDRVRRAGPTTERILRAASVIGTTFAPADVERLLVGETEIAATLLDATADGLLDTAGSMFVFASLVIREALYETTLGPMRMSYHRALAESSDDGWAKASHLEAAGDFGDAARAWMVAAEQARRSFANHDVVETFGRAAAMAARSGEEEIRALALLGRGAANEEIGNYDLATVDHREAEKIARELPNNALLTGAIERLGWTAYYARDVEEARDRMVEAVAMPGAHPSAWVLAGRIHHWGGEFERAADAYRNALDNPDDGSDHVRASALSCLGALLEHGDRYDEALRILDEAVELSQNIGAFRPLLRALFFQGIARANAGKLTGALTALETKATLLDRYEVTFYEARTRTCLAWVWRELGEQTRSRSLSESALEASRRVEKGELQIEQELHALCSLADCDLLDGRFEEAAERVAAAGELLSGWLPFHWRAELRVTELRARLGLSDPEELRIQAEQARSTKYRALAAGYAGDLDRAAALAAETGSLLLLAEVGPPSARRRATVDLAAGLPRALRRGFVTGGRLARMSELPGPTD